MYACIYIYIYDCVNGDCVCPQKNIMESLFDLFRLTVPQWTSDFATALVSIGEWSHTEIRYRIHY